MQLTNHGILRAIHFPRLRFVAGCRAEIHFSRVVLGLPILVLFILITIQVHGNGWEHTAIPFEALVKTLDFEAPEMRMRAAHSLGVRGQSEAVGPLFQCLSKPEKNQLVRAVLFSALGQLGDRRALPAFSACLNNETREEQGLTLLFHSPTHKKIQPRAKR